MTNIRRELVIDYVRRYNPSTIKELKGKLAEGGIRSSDEDLLEIVRELQRDGVISLAHQRHVSFFRFISSPDAVWWVYSIISISVLELLLVVYHPQSVFLLGVRILFGLALLGFLPGYSTVKVLFPGDPYPPLERVLLSVFLSVVVSIGLGVILGAGYFFTGVSSVTFSVSYTVALTLLASYRRYSFLLGSGDLGQKAGTNAG